MITTRAAYGRNPSEPQPALLRLPAELRYKIYYQIYQPRIYHLSGPLSTLQVDHPECKTPIYEKCGQNQCFRWADCRTEIKPLRKICHDSHRNCGCNLAGAVRFLRVCRQVYIEAQPLFLHCSTLAFQPLDREAIPKRDSKIPKQRRLSQNITKQLRMFHQRYLLSSLSGLAPINLVRRLQLGLSQWESETKTCLKFIRECKWELESLDIIWRHGIWDVCSESRFLWSGGFQGLSCLRDVKKMTFKWPCIYVGYLLSDNNQGPLEEDGRPEDPCVGEDVYAEIVSQALRELAVRPTEEGKCSWASMHNEAREIFLSRLNQLIADTGRSFGLDPDL